MGTSSPELVTEVFDNEVHNDSTYSINCDAVNRSREDDEGNLSQSSNGIGAVTTFELQYAVCTTFAALPKNVPMTLRPEHRY